jgi:hypothetical protein
MYIARSERINVGAFVCVGMRENVHQSTSWNVLVASFCAKRFFERLQAHSAVSTATGLKVSKVG